MFKCLSDKLKELLVDIKTGKNSKGTWGHKPRLVEERFENTYSFCDFREKKNVCYLIAECCHAIALLHEVRNLFNVNYPEKRNKYGGDVTRPPCLPDLNNFSFEVT